MILVDTSVWIDHLRSSDATLAEKLESEQVLTHPYVIGELALGNLRQRNTILDALQALPIVNVATDQEVLQFIDGNALFGLGIGYVDAHLLAAIRLTPGAAIWTHDKRLASAAAYLGLAVPASH